MKETEEDGNKWKDSPRSWIRRTNRVKMYVLAKAIYRFGAIPIKMPLVFCTEIEPPILNVYETTKDPE